MKWMDSGRDSYVLFTHNYSNNKAICFIHPTLSQDVNLYSFNASNYIGIDLLLPLNGSV